jgi:hypothetical protein
MERVKKLGTLRQTKPGVVVVAVAGAVIRRFFLFPGMY